MLKGRGNVFREKKKKVKLRGRKMLIKGGWLMVRAGR